MMHARPAVLLLLALALLSLAGCGQSSVTFNNTLAALEKKVEGPTKELKRNFDEYWLTRKFDGAKAEKDYDAVVAVIDQVIAEAKAVKPPDVKLAREFQDAFVTFYTEQKAVVTGEVRQALDALKDAATPEAEKEGKLRALEAGMATKAMMSTVKLRSVQQRYAAANEMQISVAQ